LLCPNTNKCLTGQTSLWCRRLLDTEETSRTFETTRLGGGDVGEIWAVVARVTLPADLYGTLLGTVVARGTGETVSLHCRPSLVAQGATWARHGRQDAWWGREDVIWLL